MRNNDRGNQAIKARLKAKTESGQKAHFSNLISKFAQSLKHEMQKNQEKFLSNIKKEEKNPNY
jgi:hypothetical protein